MARIQETNLDISGTQENSETNQQVNSETNTDTILYISAADAEKEIKEYLKKMNKDIGYFWWKYYTYCAFWANVSVPINLTITILTALTTGQTATGSLIDNHTSTIFGIVVLIVSIFNTFFRPTQQLNENEDEKKKWAELGTKFEVLYYNCIHNDQISTNYKEAEDLFKSVGVLKRETKNNYLIDLIFIFTKRIIGDDISWINKKDFRRKLRGENTDSENSFDIDL